MLSPKLNELHSQNASPFADARCQSLHPNGDVCASRAFAAQELEARLASVAGFREQQGSIACEMQYLRSERDKAKRELAEQVMVSLRAQQPWTACQATLWSRQHVQVIHAFMT